MTTFNKITREKVLECLKQVREPVLNEDIISLGLVRECGDSGFPVVAGYPKSPLSERFLKIAEAVRKALK